jgi:hypothetical protein
VIPVSEKAQLREILKMNQRIKDFLMRWFSIRAQPPFDSAP